jgi:hypothetical protein
MGGTCSTNGVRGSRIVYWWESQRERRQLGGEGWIIKKTQWSESAIELYRPSDRRLSAKRLPNCIDR